MGELRFSTEHRRLPDAAVFGDVLGPGLSGTVEGKTIQFVAYELGDISLPSGRVVAADGMIMDEKPFVRSVPPGKYPLTIAVAQLEDDERIAFAQIRFSPKAVATWEMALTEGQKVEALAADRFFGYGVDSGTGSFADPGAAELVSAASDPGMKFFDRLMAEMQKVYKPTRDWVRIETPKGTAVLFSSGFGDGSYPSYFGLDEMGNAVALVTEFGVVDWKPTLSKPIKTPPGL